MIRSALRVAAALVVATAAAVTAQGDYNTLKIDAWCMPRVQQVTTTETITAYVTDTYYHVNTQSRTRHQSLLLTKTLQLTQYLTQTQALTQPVTQTVPRVVTSTRFQLIGVTQLCQQQTPTGYGMPDLVGY